MSQEAEHKDFEEAQPKPSKVSKPILALAGAGLVMSLAWVGLSGLKGRRLETISSHNKVELNLPYRGLCTDLTVSEGGKRLSPSAKAIKGGIATLTLELPDGDHDLTLGFQGPIPGLRHVYPYKVVIDRQAPELTVSLGGVRKVQSDLVTTEKELHLELATEVGAQVLLEGRPLEGVKDGGLSLAVPLQPGWNHLLVTAVDAAGNQTQSRHSVFRDAESPEVVWDTTPDQVFNKKQARVELVIKDDGKIQGVSGQVDGSQPVAWHAKENGRWVGVTPDLYEGYHTVQVKAVDQVGNVVNAQRQVVIDSSEALGDAVLGLGARGEDAKLLNDRLVEAGYLPKGTVAGTFTKDTERALKELQKKEGYKITGRAEGQTLAALGPRIYINLSNFSLVLDRPGKKERRWMVASGSYDHPTPTGKFVIWEKVYNPPWLPPKSPWAKDAKPVPPGPDNPLGSRWMGFDWGGVGIHGTNAPWTVGSAASHGCLRMVTSQVEELYDLVEVGTPVTVLGGWEHDPALDKYWPKEKPQTTAKEETKKSEESASTELEKSGTTAETGESPEARRSQKEAGADSSAALANR